MYTKLMRLSKYGITIAAAELGIETVQYEQLLGLFKARIGEGIDELDQAIDSGDIATASRAVHSIKGTAQNMRLEMVAEPAIEIEAYIRAGDVAAAAASMENLRNAFAQMIEQAREEGIELVAPD